jgi:outer membrane immunogenic protein
MRSIIIACGITALATSAMAADLPVKAPPPPAPVYTWTGCYIGGNVGWARTESRLRINGFEDGRLSSDGFAGGGQIGCDLQFPNSNWLIGIRGMFDAMSSNDDDHFSVLFPADRFHNRSRSFATINGRVGYLWSQTFLVYATGGWGFVRNRFDMFDTVRNVPLVVGTGNRNSNGGDVGGGFEWMFTQSSWGAWSLWVEYDHIFLSNRDLFITPAVGPAFTANIERDFDKVLVGINLRFGGPGGPVRASY